MIVFENWPRDYPWIREFQREQQKRLIERLLPTLRGMISRGQLLQLLKNLEADGRRER